LSPTWRRRRNIRRILLALAAILAGLLVAESFLYIFPADIRFLQRIVPQYQSSGNQAFEVDPDPRILSRLSQLNAPVGHNAIHVNSLGFRGPDRSLEPTPGKFRIICVGGSNVWGTRVEEYESWPARLEAHLNAACPDRYEVWNLGVPGYNLIQMNAVSERALKNFNPDLLVYAPSNVGPRFFMSNTPSILSYFKKDPTLWLDLFFPNDLYPTGLALEKRIWLLEHVRIYRLAMLANLAIISGSEFRAPRHDMPHYLEPTRKFLAQTKATLPLAVFLCPAVADPNPFEAHLDRLGLHTLALTAEGKSKEYFEWHPPAYVLDWYGENLAKWISEEGLLPGCSQ
jgi:hypothetical protein